MIAATRPFSPDVRTVFEQHYLPEILRRSYAHFSRLDPAAREEAVQDCVCDTWLAFTSAMARGKKVTAEPAGCRTNQGRGHRGCVTPGTLALFANCAYDTGRRFAGTSSEDVLADKTRLTGRVRVVSLDDAPPYPDGLNDGTIREVLADRRMENRPDELACQRMDWSAFRLSGLLRLKEQVALDLLAAGYTNNELSTSLDVSAPRACQIKDNLAEAVVQFFGADAVPSGSRRIRRNPKLAQPRSRRGAAIAAG